MGSVNLASVFLVVTCFANVLSFEIGREKLGKDLLKFSFPSKSKISSLAKRRVRRDSKDDHPDVFNVNKQEGPCNNPAHAEERRLQKFDVSLSFDCSNLYLCKLRSLAYWLCLRKFRLQLVLISSGCLKTRQS